MIIAYHHHTVQTRKSLAMDQKYHYKALPSAHHLNAMHSAHLLDADPHSQNMAKRFRFHLKMIPRGRWCTLFNVFGCNIEHGEICSDFDLTTYC